MVGDAETLGTLERLTDQIRRFAPHVGELLGNDQTVREYATARLSGGSGMVPQRVERIEAICRDMIARLFGAGYATSAELDLGAVNIVDHHQLLNHPLLLGTNVIASAGDLLGGGAGRPIVTFSCSNVTPRNEYMRRGVRLAGRDIPYFSSRERHDAVLALPVREFDFVRRLADHGEWSRLDADERDFIEDFEATLNAVDRSRCASHADQISLAVHATWPMLFDETLRPGLRPLLYLPIEEVAGRYLAELLAQDDNFLVESLIDPRLATDVIEEFNGVQTAWDRAAGRGTHFFWRRDPGSHRPLRMWVDGGWLVPHREDRSELAIELSRPALIDGLTTGKLIPVLALAMSAVHMLAGIRPLVGPGSLIYSTKLRDGWVRILRARGAADEAVRIAGIDTSGLIAGAPVFFSRRRGGQIGADYACDAMRRGGVSRGYLERLLGSSYGDLLTVGVSGFYGLLANYYIPGGERIADVPSLDESATLMHRWV